MIKPANAGFESTGDQSASISRLVVQVTAEYTGRGPTRAHTYVADDLVTVVLEQILTKAEHGLVRDGQGDLVLTVRRAYQATMEPALIRGVEAITGREVQACLSANNIEADISVESFVLKPRATNSE